MDDIMMTRKTPAEKSLLDRSIQIFKVINLIRENYYLKLNLINDLAKKIVLIVKYAQKYVAEEEEKHLKDVLTEDDLLLDKYNKILL